LDLFGFRSCLIGERKLASIRTEIVGLTPPAGSLCPLIRQRCIRDAEAFFWGVRRQVIPRAPGSSGEPRPIESSHRYCTFGKNGTLSCVRQVLQKTSRVLEGVCVYSGSVVISLLCVVAFRGPCKASNKPAPGDCLVEYQHIVVVAQSFIDRWRKLLQR